jgi:hypothetical protein
MEQHDLDERAPRPLFGNQIREAREVLAEARERRREHRPPEDEEFRPLFGNRIREAMTVIAEARERRRRR